jgi:plasmid stabilization system protein ParE
MSQIIYSEQTNHDFLRFSDFMESVNPEMKKEVVSTIMRGISILKNHPEIVAFCKDERYKHMRELFIPFGKNGYCVLYQYTVATDTVLIAAIRHSRESGYKMV